MNSKSMRRLLLAGVVVAVLLLAFGLMGRPGTPAKGNNIFALQAPPFVGVALANTDSVTSTIENEAGISAYFQASTIINLADVRGVFRTIETETADYIIGSVAVPNYIESADPHVYVHRNGWILAYYMRSDPVSKIIDTVGSRITTTKLKTVVAAVASAAGAPFTDVAYYDFRYPNATHMMLIAEDWWNGNDFTIKLPSTYGYFERGWALNNIGCGTWYGVSLDSVSLLVTGSDASCVVYGSIRADQLLPDVTHTVAVSEPDWCAIVILYRVP